MLNSFICILDFKSAAFYIKFQILLYSKLVDIYRGRKRSVRISVEKVMVSVDEIFEKYLMK